MASKIIEGMKEAVAFAKGDSPAPRIYMYGHAYVPERNLIAVLQREAETTKRHDDKLDVLEDRIRELLEALKVLLNATMYRDHPEESQMAIDAIAKAEGK